MRFCSTIAITINWELPLLSEVILTLPASLRVSGCRCWSSVSEVGSAHGAASILPSPLGWAWWWGNLSFWSLAGLGFSFINFLIRPKYFSQAASCSPPSPRHTKGGPWFVRAGSSPCGDAGVKPVTPSQTMARLRPEPLRCPVSGGRNRI